MMKDLLSKVTGKSETQPRFEIDGKKVLSVGFPELDALHVYGYMIGEGMAMFGQSRGPLYIVNTGTNKIKKLVDENSKVVGFTKEDIDYKSLDGIEHTGDAYRMEVDYAGMGRYSDFCDGICAIYWMLYPDGMYFADEDGFGMEDNDEVEIYCVIDKDFNVLRPFRPVSDVRALLSEVNDERGKL
jgi:hypothetical protein